MGTTTFDIHGNPGSGNTFSETNNNFGNVGSYAPNATVVNVNNCPQAKTRHALITDIILRLSELDIDESGELSDAEAFMIDRKITYNRIISWRERIDNYAPAALKMVDGIYGEFDRQGRSLSKSVLRSLHDLYCTFKYKYDDKDELFDKLRDTVYDLVNQDPKCSDDVYVETLRECVTIVLVDAFMKCRIFEKPEEEQQEDAYS